MRGSGTRRSCPAAQAGVLVVGAAEPEIQSWLRAAGHAPAAVRRADAAGAALEEEPVDLVIVDRDSSGLDAPEVCRLLRDDPRLGDAWMLAITVAAKGRMADSVLDAGADDYLHRPFTRAELIARARAGLRAARAARQRPPAADADGERPGRDLPLRLARRLRAGGDQRRDRADLGLPAAELPRLAASARSSRSSTPTTSTSCSRPSRTRPRTDEPFVLEYRIVRADGEVRWVLDRGQPVRGPGGRLWLDGALFDITERRAAEAALLAHKVEAARTAELRASRQRILEAADAARRKIERDLHDGAQQRLVSLVLDVQVARRRLAKDPSQVGAFLERLGTRAPGGLDRAARARPRHPSRRC